MVAKVLRWLADRWAWLLIGVLLVTVTFYKLGEVPWSFDGDEAAMGYYAYSLIERGEDEFGNKWPLYFKSIGDYKYPVYPYLSMIPVALLGLSEFSSRFLAGIAGILMVVLVLRLWSKVSQKKNLFRQRVVMIVGVVIVASSSWYLMFSRGAYEATLGMAFVVLGIVGVYSQVKSKLSGGRYLQWWPFLMFGVAAMTYSAYRLFTPLWLGLVWLGLRSKRHVKTRWLGMGLLLLILFLGAMSLDWRGRARAGGLFFANNGAVWEESELQIAEIGRIYPGMKGVRIARVMDNRLVVMGWSWLENYARHFDWSYLFVRGNPNLAEYHVPKAGVLPWVALPLLGLGLYELFKKWRGNMLYQWVGWWLLLAPVASATAVETPNPIRSLLMLPAFIFIVLLGIDRLWRMAQKKRLLVIGVLIFLVLVNGLYGLKQYWIHREYHRPWYTDQGVREMTDYVLEHKGEYENVVLPQDPYIFFLFYGEPAGKVGVGDLVVNDDQWSSVERLGKIIFGMPTNCPKVGKEKVLYVCKGGEVPQNAQLRSVFRFNDTLPAFVLVEFFTLSQMPDPLPELPSRLNYMVETDPRNDGVIPASEERFW